MKKEIRDEVSEAFSIHTEHARTPGYYHAFWTAPGMGSRPVKHDNGQFALFESETEAEIGAAQDMFRVLNRPRKFANRGKPEVYTKMEANEFAVALGHAGITPSFFAYLYGTSQDKVLKWIDGTDGVPHPARLLLAVFTTTPEAVDVAESVTMQFTKARRPERKDA